MKVLVLATRNPFPPQSGRSKVLADCCWYLSYVLKHEIVLCMCDEDGDNPISVPEYIKSIYKLKSPSWFVRLWNVLHRSIILGNQPLQVALYDCVNVRKQVKKIIEEEKPDVVIADMARLGCLCWYLGVPAILHLDDLLSRRYEQQLKTGQLGNAFGKLEEHLPFPFSRVARMKFLQKLLLEREVRLLKQYEIELSNKFKSVVLVSPYEANLLQEKVAAKCFAIPPSIDIEQFNCLTALKKITKDVPRLGFVGAMDVAHNESAVIYFYNHILPLVKKRVENIEFIIIGANPTPEVQKLGNDPVVNVTGRVKNIYEYILSCDVMVAPLTFGSGIKIKVLESMACGIPVVATSVAAEGIGAENGVHMMIADNPEDFCSAIVSLLNDSKLRQKIAKNAQEYVFSYFAHDSILKVWREIFSYTLDTNN